MLCSARWTTRRSPELDKQIEGVFKTLGEWKPGKLKRKDVDTSRLFSFVIKDGKVTLNKSENEQYP